MVYQGYQFANFANIFPLLPWQNEMPERILDIFKRVFSRIPQKVIWQWRNPDKDLKMPSNVLVSNWLPQQDVLGILRV